jgi:hypothetical protein
LRLSLVELDVIPVEGDFSYPSGKLSGRLIAAISSAGNVRELMSAPGQRAKLISTLDNRMADDLESLFKIEISLQKSPKRGVKCGAIVIFKLNDVGLDLGAALNLEKSPTAEHLRRKAQEMQEEANKQTEVMYMDPIYFAETEGRWVEWALRRALELYDRFPGPIYVKCSKLRIAERRTMKEVAAGRSNLRDLFSVAWDIDRLLEGDFRYDPWTKTIRRGRISAEMSKR